MGFYIVTLESCLPLSTDVNTLISFDLKNIFSENIANINACICLPKDTHERVDSSIIHIGQKLEKLHCTSIKEQINNLRLIYMKYFTQ